MTLADKGTRIGNFIIDTIVLGVIALILTYIMYLFFPETAYNSSRTIDILFSVLFFTYYFFLEFFWGRTVGKIITKTIVVDNNGNKPKVFKLVIRTLMRFLPIEGITFLFGTGLHDVISKTTVIKVEKRDKNTTQ